MVIGMAERNGRVHLESRSNRRFESIKPVLDAKLAEDTKEVVTDGNPTYLRLIPQKKHCRGNHGKELAERVWTTTQTVENVPQKCRNVSPGGFDGTIGVTFPRSTWLSSERLTISREPSPTASESVSTIPPKRIPNARATIAPPISR